MQNIFSEGDSDSAGQEIPPLLRKLMVYYRVHRSLSFEPILNYFHPVQTLTPYPF